MKKVLMMAIATMMAVGMTSCSASGDDFSDNLAASSASSSSEFSLLSYSKSVGTPISGDDTQSAEMTEKLVCKVLAGGELKLTHKNVIFDENTDIKFSTELVGNKLIVSETGNYGKSGKYGYYTLVATVGKIKDGDYVVVVKRNNHVREEFKMTYDSSKAK